MDPITVNTTPAAAAVTPAAAAAPAVSPDDLAALRTELAGLKGQVGETQRAAEYWMERANNRTETPAPAAVTEVEEEIDMLDLLSTQGAKGFDKFMRSRGYASKAEVEAAVNSKAAQLSAEAELIGQYADLRDKNSEFFQATARAYGELKQQGVPEALAMRLAAEKAELQGFKSGKVKTPTQKTADDAATKEAARLARVKAQAGDRSARAAETSAEDDDEMTAAELHICEAMGITPEAYQARAKAGVRMGGTGRKK